MTSAIISRAKKNSSEVLPKKASASVKKKIAASMPAATVAMASAISVEERFHMIREAAYYISEKNGFNPELELSSWLQAEKEINDKLLH